jgi:Fe-Mn family superoxide dismutase
MMNSRSGNDDGAIPRRQFLLGAAAAAAALTLSPGSARADSADVFTLPPLGYAPSALEPHIDTETMTIHHDKHHAVYVKNLNAALATAGGDYRIWPLEKLVKQYNDLPEKVRTAVRNNGGGHYNHSLFWKMIGPPRGGAPSSELGKAIARTFTDFKGFQTAFTEGAMGRFGSGWVWLVRDGDGKVSLASTANQDCPLTEDKQPLLGIDLWEHAYYLKYQNRRKDYVDAWWNVVQWDDVNKRYSGEVTGV